MSSVPVVFNEQDPQWLWWMLRSARIEISFCDAFWQGVKRYLESCAETAAGALGFDCAMVKIDKMLGNCQTQAKPTKLAAYGRISLLEWPKQRGHPLGFYSNPIVAEFEMETAVLIVKGANGNLSSW